MQSIPNQRHYVTETGGWSPATVIAVSRRCHPRGVVPSGVVLLTCPFTAQQPTDVAHPRGSPPRFTAPGRHRAIGITHSPGLRWSSPRIVTHTSKSRARHRSITFPRFRTAPLAIALSLSLSLSRDPRTTPTDSGRAFARSRPGRAFGGAQRICAVPRSRAAPLDRSTLSRILTRPRTSSPRRSPRVVATATLRSTIRSDGTRVSPSRPAASDCARERAGRRGRVHGSPRRTVNPRHPLQRRAGRRGFDVASLCRLTPSPVTTSSHSPSTTAVLGSHKRTAR